MPGTIYLDNAATSFPKPGPVVKAVVRTMESVGGNPGRGGRSRALQAARILFDTRMAIADLLKLGHPERIIFTRNATEGLNMALKGLLRKGDTAAISALEHNSVTRPLHALKKRGVKFHHALLDKNGLPDPKHVPKVKMLVTTGASNVTGAVADVAALGKACRRLGVLFMVDAAQTAGAMPFDTSNIDVLVCSGHKALLGPQGVGFVWFSPGVEPDTWMEGGTGSDSESLNMPSYWPDRHEAGTMNTPGIAGLGAGVKFLLKKGLVGVREKEVALCRAIIEWMANDDRIILYPPRGPEERAGLVSFNVKGMDPAEAGDTLDRKGVACRVGLHCSPDAHRFMGTFPDGAVRVSPGVMSTMKEVKTFLSILDRVARRR